jgi:hypothetical protein
MASGRGRFIGTTTIIVIISDALVANAKDKACSSTTKKPLQQQSHCQALV